MLLAVRETGSIVTRRGDGVEWWRSLSESCASARALVGCFGSSQLAAGAQAECRQAGLQVVGQ